MSTSPAPTPSRPARKAAVPRPLRGVRILSLALNLPGPAALMRCVQMGARAVKIEPPAGDPMKHYNPACYATLHQGVRVVTADARTPRGLAAMERELARADVLLTSFRPSALAKFGLDWRALHKRHPRLCQVAIVGAPGERDEEPGHDLTYLAENDLVTGLDLPATLFADMGGALAASEAVLRALRLRDSSRSGAGVHLEVALSDAAAWLGLPRAWGLTQPSGAVGGAHAGYQVYACKNGRVAVAALEPHFAAALAAAAGLPDGGLKTMLNPATRTALAAWFATLTRAQVQRLARERDIPMHAVA